MRTALILCSVFLKNLSVQFTQNELIVFASDAFFRFSTEKSR